MVSVRWPGLRNRSGTLHLPLSLIFVMITTSSGSLVAMMHDWRRQAELQLMLDRCVGKAAAELRDRQRRIERGNTRIRALRVALIPASLKPPVRKGLEVALKAQVLEQEILLRSWNAKQLLWLARRGCGIPGSIPTPLPSLAWVRDPPDALGPRALRWPKGVSQKLAVRVIGRSRSAAAHVYFDEKGESDGWFMDWGAPGLPGTDLY